MKYRVTDEGREAFGMDEAERTRGMNRQLDRQRPKYHPDFDIITKIHRDMDAAMDSGDDLEPYIRQYIDPATLIYVADQRAIRGLDGHGMKPGTALYDALRILLAATFIDGWLNGRQFANRPPAA